MVIGCGNLNRRDDGAGVVVAQRLDAALSPRERQWATVIDAGTDGMGVLIRAGAAGAMGAVIIVDASRSGSDPGAIYEVPGAELESVPNPSFNLHDFRWDHALYAGRRLYGDDFPRDVRVFLIEAADLSLGVGLSAAVAGAVDRVVELIRQRIVAAGGDAVDAPAGSADTGRRADTAGSAGAADIADSADAADIADSADAADRLTLARGGLRLPVAVWQRHFAGLDSVLMMPRGDSLLILPVQPGGGGQLVKVINLAGDRVVSGVELFRSLGVDAERIDGDRQVSYRARWSDADAALVIDRFFC
jgi:hydrogenase maturation protease